jgi:hypothetical protein
MTSVSIVITTYNRAQFLQRAIESALKAASDCEVLVVDDCSADNTPSVCANRSDIRYVRLDANQGLANARNVGIAESSSAFIAFLDDDDLRLPGSIDKQLHRIAADDQIAICYGQALIGDARRQLPTGEIYPAECPEGDIFWQLLEDNFIPMPSVLARKSCLLSAGGFSTSLSLIEDWDMWLRLSERFLFAAVSEPVAIHRKANAESDQMSSNSAALCKQALEVQQRALTRSRAQAGARAQRRQVRSKLRDRAYQISITEATNLIRAGDVQSARARLRDAFHFRPFRALSSGRLRLLLIK